LNPGSAFVRVDGSLVGRPTQPTWVVCSSLTKARRTPGKPSLEGGEAQWRYVLTAISAAKQAQVDALCTAPVSKAQILKSGHPFVGHTELLAQAFGAEVMMLLDGPKLKVALATNHLALDAVSRTLSQPLLVKRLKLLSQGLRKTLRRAPRIAVCALNPHAGDEGVCGTEDQTIVAPAVRQARSEGIRCEGPFPADGLFARHAKGFDAVLAMYHDQGLIPVKALDFARTVNVTLGLPVPRTSPDHGVAYDIAGKGKADSGPMREALLKAAGLVRKG
jgi:4-hydroxythreonine-4-phosphate dehydrogenase